MLRMHLIYQPRIGISRYARGWLTLAYRQINKGGIHQGRWPLLICSRKAWRDSAGQLNMTRLWRIWSQESKQEVITATWWCLIYSNALTFTLYDIHLCYTRSFCLTTMKKVLPGQLYHRIKSHFLKKECLWKTVFFLENDWKGYTEGCFMSLHDWICVHWKISEMKGWIDFSSLILAWRGFICFLDQKKRETKYHKN